MIRNVDGVTHVLYMRFPTKEALTEYLNDRYRLEISYKYIVPVFNVCKSDRSFPAFSSVSRVDA